MDDILLKRILSEDGRVIRYPSKLKQRVFAVDYISHKFEDKVYTEREVNAVIRQWIEFADYVLIRRDLVDYGYLTRKSDGSEYRPAEKLPTPEEVLAKY